MTSRPVRMAAGTIADSRRAASFWGAWYYRFARAAIVLCYSAIADAAASANGLPSESRHTAH